MIMSDGQIKVTVYRTVQQRHEFYIDVDPSATLEQRVDLVVLDISDGDFIDLEVDEQNVVIGNNDGYGDEI